MTLYNEQLVSRQNETALLYPDLVVLFSLQFLIAVWGQCFVWSFLLLFAGALIALIAYYFISPQLSVEYEYTILNHDLQIDAIYNKIKKKAKDDFRYPDCEIIAPKDSHRMDSYRPGKTYDFSSGRSSEKTYAIMISYKQQNACVLIDPDTRMVDHMVQWMGSKMFTD